MWLNLTEAFFFAKSFPDICKKVWDCTQAIVGVCLISLQKCAHSHVHHYRWLNCFSPHATYLRVPVQIHLLALWKNLTITKYEFRKGQFTVNPRDLSANREWSKKITIFCDVCPRTWGFTMDHFSSLDARSSYMCYKCNFSSKSACYLKQHLLNLKLSHFIHFHFF